MKRRFERGGFPTQTLLGEPKRKIIRRHGGNLKVRVVKEKNACVTNPDTGKTEKTEITRVVRNPANVDYNRRGVITKGTIIETSLGLAKVTSRPGQHGIINAVLIEKEEAENT
jgi:small subunit ribosomal protein S8e